LHRDVDDTVREKVRRLLDGKDGLKPRARQIASVMRGGTSGQGLRLEETISPQEHAAAWYIAELRGYGVPDEEILRRLQTNSAFLTNLKQIRQVVMKDVQRLGNLRLTPLEE
jgi:hypothetical protein